MNRLFCFSGIIHKKNLTGAVSLYSFENELPFFPDPVKWPGEMRKVVQLAKTAHVVDELLSHRFIKKEFLNEDSVKTVLDLFAFNHFQDLPIMVFKERVNSSTSLWVLNAEKLTLTVPSGNVPKALCMSGAQCRPVRTLISNDSWRI